MEVSRVINSWTDLTNLVQKHRNDFWLYRGESSDHGSLRPKAGRIGSMRGHLSMIGENFR